MEICDSCAVLESMIYLRRRSVICTSGINKDIMIELPVLFYIYRYSNARIAS